ncbi:MAG: hypothetical protein V2I26_17210 [Halieaceae bacterium]|jgi:hypothetical protein|nr:hypothetical protein [Halieaceae bacterium]
MLMSIAAYAQEYQRPTPPSGSSSPPTSADLVSFDGAQDTVVVQIVNMTPFDIELKDTTPEMIPPAMSSSSIGAYESEMTDRDRENKKSFMFAPVGIPGFIPGVPRKAFKDLEEYDPDYVNTDSRSYSMVFSWDDMGGYVTDSWVKWTVRDVEYCTVWDQNTNLCVGDDGNYRGPNWATRDVDVGLWMYRNQPNVAATSNAFPMIVDTLKVVFRTAALVVDPARVAPWVREILGMVELASGDAEFLKENAEPDEGNKMYLASYPVPHPQSLCVYDPTNNACTPTTMSQDDTGDGVYSLWADEWAAPCPDHSKCPQLSAEGNLVVTAHLLRGHSAPRCPEGPTGSDTCDLGSVPILMVTIMRTWDFALSALAGFGNFGEPQSNALSAGGISRMHKFLLQAGAGRIWARLKTSGEPGLDRLHFILHRLSPEHRLVLTDMLRNMGSEKRPTQKECQLVHWIAASLQKQLRSERRNEPCPSCQKGY